MLNNKLNSLGSCLAALIGGLLLVVMPYGVLKDMLFTIIGIIIVVVNIFPCILYWLSYKTDNKYLMPAVMATISVVVGFVFIFWHDWIVSIILAIWLIILPIYRICTSQNWKTQLKKEITYFIIAALLFFTPFEAIFAIVLKVFGIILMVWGLISLIIYAVNNKNTDNNDDNSNNNRSDRIIIDADVKDI